MIKELGRLKRKGDDDGKLKYFHKFLSTPNQSEYLCHAACELISEDVDVIINELHHVGDALHMS